MARRITSRHEDFGGGIVGGVSEYGKRVRWLKIAQNVTLEPFGALSVRSGSQRFSSATLADKPHSCMEWVTTAGVGHVYVGCEGASGKLFEATTGAFTQQTTPYAMAPAAKMVADQMNAALWAVEQGAATPPIFMRAGNPANKWHSGLLPRPAFPAIAAGTTVSGGSIPGATTLTASTVAGDTTATMSNNAGLTANITLVVGSGFAQYSIPNVQTTAGSNVLRYQSNGAGAGLQMTLTGAGGGGLTAAVTYHYRMRYRGTDGSSRSSAVHSIAMGANTQVQITNIANEIRSDYIGWTLERTKSDGSAAGPFYLVTDGTGTAYNDVLADAALGDRSEENVHGEPPHMDGILAYKDRMVGWAGSTVFVSNPIAYIEATGIANWDARNSLDIGKDDGDTIQFVGVQVDRLVVLKTWSAWAIEGDDPTNMRVLPLYKGAGCSGARAACTMGSDVYWWGAAGLHRLRGNTVSPFGWPEVGHIFRTFRSGQYADVVVKNYLGQQVLVLFSSMTGTNDDILAFDLRYQGWTEYTGLYWNDLLVQKAGTFGDARAVVAIDRRDLDSGAGTDYPVWLGFYGFRDEKAYDGTGGHAPTVILETPMLDDGMADVDKDWESIMFYAAGTAVTLGVTLTLDPLETRSFSVTTPAAGSLWAGPNWGAFTWASAIDSAQSTGIPLGAIGRRYSLRVAASPDSDLIFKGYAMDGIVQPKSDYSRTR